MAILFKDRVKDTSTTTGTGDFTLAGSAPSGFITFNTAYGTGSGNQFYYVIDNGSEWEVGISYLSASTTLERGGNQTVLASTNAGAAVSFSSGTKQVYSDVPAAHFIQKASIILDHTAIKALPTPTPVTVVPAPGSGKAILFERGYIQLNRHATDEYTTPLNSTIGFATWDGVAQYANLSQITNATETDEVFGTDPLDAPYNVVGWQFFPAEKVPSLTGTESRAYYIGEGENLAVCVFMTSDNGAMTGGNATDTMEVTVHYRIVNV